MMKSILEKYKFKDIKPYLWIFLLSITSLFYFLINHSPKGKVYSLHTDLDKLVPFISGFIIPYMLYMPNVIFSLIFLCKKDREKYYISLTTLIVCNFICLTIYLFFQTQVPRETIFHNDFLCNLVKYIYSTDNPYNCFPSIHVAATYSILKGINLTNSINKKQKLIWNILCWLIIISTQFVKQHVLMDLFAALFLVELIYKLVVYLYSLINKKLLLPDKVPLECNIDDEL